MTKVKIEYVGGGHDLLPLDDTQRGALVSAKAARDPAHIIDNGDGSHTVLDTQNIRRIDYRLPGQDVGSDTDETEDTRTVAELKDALDAGGVEYGSDLRKADLQDLAKQHNL